MKMRFSWHLFFRSFIGYPGICGIESGNSGKALNQIFGSPLYLNYGIPGKAFYRTNKKCMKREMRKLKYNTDNM